MSSILPIILVIFKKGVLGKGGLVKTINFAENLRNLRRGADMSQKKLASLLGVDQRTISAWENGVCEPSYTLLAQLCEIFDESFDEILT